MSFLILSLPRSRSAWLAHYLSYPRVRKPVGHEILTDCDSVDKFLKSYEYGMWGTVETGGAALWRVVRKELPLCRIVLIRRPLIDVYNSLAKIGIVGDLTYLAESDAMLDAASQDPGIMSVPFDLLEHAGACAAIFEHCLEEEFDPYWWWSMSNMNVQVDAPAWIERIKENQHTHEKFRKDLSDRLGQTWQLH